MATQTENLGLTKPNAAEGYDINVFNNNADAIDQFAGEMRNALGGAGGGLGDKVDTLLENVAAVKTDTAALVQALATANANIATLLNSSGSVKAIIRGSYTSTGVPSTINIPSTMNADKVILLIDYRPSSTTTIQGLSYVKKDEGFEISAAAGIISYQLIEFY